MVLPKTNAVRPQGSVIEGKDKTGRRYKYVVGHRGRVSLGDAKQSSGGKAPAGPRDVAIRAKAANKVATNQGSSVHARSMAKKIIANHAEWEKSGDLYTAGRLSELFAKGRNKLLKQGNKSEAHRAFAGIVLATIFHSNYHGKKKGGKYNITFNAGGAGKPGYIKFKTKDGKEVGGITFNDITKISEGDISKARDAFHSLAEKAKGTPTPKHKSATHEHTAMVQAMAVEPPKTATPKAEPKAKPADSKGGEAKQSAKKEVIPGGKGDKKPDSAFDPEALKQGMKVESEHTKDPKVQKEIAKDHLTEDPKYYEKLKKVEAKPTKAFLNKPNISKASTRSLMRVAKKGGSILHKGTPKPYNKGNRHKIAAGSKSANEQIVDAKKRKSEDDIKRDQKKRLRKG